VVESVRRRADLSSDNALLANIGPDVTITRLSTIVKRDDLTADVSLMGPAPSAVPDSITLPEKAAVGVLPLLGLMALAWRRRRPPRGDSGILERCKARGA